MFLSAIKRQPRASTDRFSIFSLFPKKYPFCQFYPQTIIQDFLHCPKKSRFYRSFFNFFIFSLFPKKIPFCQFYPQTTISPSASIDRFSTFSLFPPKNTFYQFYPQTTMPISRILSICTHPDWNPYKSCFNLKSIKSPSRAYWPKTLLGLFHINISSN